MIPENPFNFFDDIVCINLDISKDRRDYVENIFKKLNIPARFLTVKKHKKGGVYGCFDSHIKILKEAYSKNLDYILVFEDDIKITNHYNLENIKKSIEFMKNNKEWDIFYLGYFPLSEKLPSNDVSTIFQTTIINNNIIKFNPYSTHAICYNKKSIKKILDEYDDYIGIIHYDIFLSKYMKFNNYCFIPVLISQKLSFEYNIEPKDIIEYILRLLYPIFEYFDIIYNISLIKYYIG